jgi:16S rRNA (adenine1518-N6/adenine1519-N6)-dimethyltransferase
LPPARKRFGQHFLEPAWVAKVIRAIEPERSQDFVEIGPGRGALTRPLAARARHVTAYEIDRDLAAKLRAEAIPNLTIVEGDFLGADVATSGIQWGVGGSGSCGGPGARRPAGAIRVAGNLPYNVASPILFRLAELYAAGVPIVDATVMLQREVAERLVARPGSRDYGVLSVLTQHVADAAIVLKLPPGAFRPAPKVHSALVRLTFHPPDPPVADAAFFAEVVQAVFMQRRKTLENALRAFARIRRRRSSGDGGDGDSGSGIDRAATRAHRFPTPEAAIGQHPGSGIVRGASRAAEFPTPDSPAAPGSGSEIGDAQSDGLRFPTPSDWRFPTPFDLRRRPETLSVAEFAQLADWLKNRS